MTAVQCSYRRSTGQLFMISKLWAPLLLVLGCGATLAWNSESLETSARAGDASSYRVSNNTQLVDAIRSARAGSTILLAAGNYSALTISRRNFDATVTIRSADKARPAHLAGIHVGNSRGILFKDIVIGRSLQPGERYSTPMVHVVRSTNIAFEAVKVQGSLDGDPANDGYGMVIRFVSDFRVENSNFEQLTRGLVISQADRILVKKNRFHDIKSDGSNFAEVTSVTIDGNHFTDFYPAFPDHPDAIQFWTKSTSKASSDIIIRNNVILMGSGRGLQGIFLRDELITLPYSRVNISNNIIYVSDTYNGITVMGGRDVTVSRNTVVSMPDDKFLLRIRLENIDGGSVEGNVSDIYLPKNLTNLSVSNNVFLKEKPKFIKKIAGIRNGPTAQVDGLLLEDFGYKPQP